MNMAYGPNPQSFPENGASVHAADALARSSRMAFRTWRTLDEERRLALVDTALRTPAEEMADGYPVAL
jgi:hypothetical protein